MRTGEACSTAVPSRGRPGGRRSPVGLRTPSTTGRSSGESRISPCARITEPPAAPRERCDQLAEALCISTITLGGLLCGVERSASRSQNLQDVEQFTARLEVIPFSVKTVAAFRPDPVRACPAWHAFGCVYDMLIGAHARGEGDARHQQCPRVPEDTGASCRQLGLAIHTARRSG